jgi:ferredoxin
MAKWKSVYIYYISGTGNAKACTEWIADEAKNRGFKTVVQQIDRLENIVFPSYEEKPLIGFAFPTHGFNSAPIMLRFITGFPRGVGNEIFLLNTRAGMKLYKLFMPGISGVALIMPAFILRLKGFKCIGFRPVDLPSNWISLHPGLKKKVIDSIFGRCEKIVRKFADKIFEGKKIYRGLFSLPVDLILSPVALGYYLGGRFFLSKTFIANYNCDNCGLCIKKCPTDSIKYVNNRPYWKLTCESCMRCMNNCPKRAIETAHGMAFGFWVLFSITNTQIILIIINTLHISSQLWWWRISAVLISILSMVAITALLYRIVHYAMRLKPLKYLIRFTSLTAFPFWRRYRHIRIDKSR